MPSWLTSDDLTVADPFIALLLIAVLMAVLRATSPARRGHQPVSPRTLRRVEAAIRRRDEVS